MTSRLRVVSLLLFAGVMASASSAWSQGRQRPLPPIVQIRGLVRLPNSASGPYGAMVLLELERGGTVSQAQTDSQGKFMFTDLVPDVYVVRVRHPGYREAAQQVNLTMGPTSYVVIDLQPLPSNTPANMPPTSVVDVASLQGMSLPEDARKELEEARKLLLEQKDAAKSISRFRKAIELYPSYAPSYLLLGAAYMDLKKSKDAQSAFEKAIQTDEKLAAAHMALGACQVAQGNFAAAEKPLVRGLELDPQSAQGHYELGKVYWSLGRWEDAEPHARKAIELHTEFNDVHLLLGNVLLRKRDGPAALREFQEYLRLEPNGQFAPPTRDIVAKLQQALGPTR